MNATYATRTEAIDREIVPALDGMVDDYDLTAIGDELIAHTDAGYVLRSDVDFWEVVARHDRTAQ